MAALTNGTGGGVVTGGMTVEEFNTKTDELIAATNAISGAGLYSKSWDEVGLITYMGEAAVGTATSASAWRIKRIDETNDPDGDVKWASEAFDQVWDDRVTLTYS